MKHWHYTRYGTIAVSILTLSFVSANEIDNTLTDLLEARFESDEGVFANDIDVATKSGIVTLSGESDSFLAKRRAGELIKTVKGVRSVINRIQVDPTEKSDSELAAQVKAAIQYNDEINPQEIEVSASKGVVTLSGTAFGWGPLQQS